MNRNFYFVFLKASYLPTSANDQRSNNREVGREVAAWFQTLNHMFTFYFFQFASQEELADKADTIEALRSALATKQLIIDRQEEQKQQAVEEAAEPLQQQIERLRAQLDTVNPTAGGNQVRGLRPTHSPFHPLPDTWHFPPPLLWYNV